MKFARAALPLAIIAASCAGEMSYDDPSLECTQYVEVGCRDLFFSPESNTGSVSVTASDSWDALVTEGSEWLSAEASEGILKIEAAANAGEFQRKGIVRVATELRSVDISVTQYAYSVSVDYYSVDIQNALWTSSRMHEVKDEDGALVAVLTEEYLGASDPRRAYFLYPAPGGVPDYDSGKEAVSNEIFLKADGSEVYVTDPHSQYEKLEAATLEAMVLTSDVKDHGMVKLGSQIWLTEDYKTTKLRDGTSISTVVKGDAWWADGSRVAVVHEADDVLHYLYTSYAIGWSATGVFDETLFAPEGWRIPSRSEYLDVLLPFVGTYDALAGDSLFGATSNFKSTKASNKVSVSALNYTNTWTSTPAASSKVYMCGLKPDGSKVDSGQALTTVFSVRLIKE